MNKRHLIFYLATSLYWFSLYTYVPTFSTYLGGLGASYKMIGLIVGSYGFAQMALRIPLGIFSDRLNRRKPFIFMGILVSLLSSFLLWHFDSVGMVLIARTMAGIAASSWVTFTVLFSSYFAKEEMPKALGLINSFTSAGQMAAIFIGGFAAQYFGSKSPFLLGIFAALAGVLVSLAIDEKSSLERKPARLRELLAVAANPAFLIVCLLAILSQFVTFATVYGFTPIAAEKIGASSLQLGVLTGLSTLPGIFASALSGAFFSKRFGERKTIIYGFIIVALSCICIPYVKSMAILYISQFIGGFGPGLVFPLLMSLSIKNVDESKRATAMGFFQAIYGVGMFLGPLIVGQLNATIGLKWGFWSTGGVAAAGVVIVYCWKGLNSQNSEV